jgi:hypothetical protein
MTVMTPRSLGNLSNGGGGGSGGGRRRGGGGGSPFSRQDPLVELSNFNTTSKLFFHISFPSFFLQFPLNLMSFFSFTVESPFVWTNPIGLFLSLNRRLV